MLIPFLGELAALGTAVCWSGTATFFSYSGKLVGSQVVNRTRLVFALVFLSISHLLLEGSLFPMQAEGFRWFWFTVSSVLGLVIGDSLLFRSFVLLGPRLSTLMMATVPIISALFGWLLFGEVLTAIEMSGVVLTVADYKRGVWLVAAAQFSGRGETHDCSMAQSPGNACNCGWLVYWAVFGNLVVTGGDSVCAVGDCFDFDGAAADYFDSCGIFCAEEAN